MTLIPQMNGIAADGAHAGRCTRRNVSVHSAARNSNGIVLNSARTGRISAVDIRHVPADNADSIARRRAGVAPAAVNGFSGIKGNHAPDRNGIVRRIPRSCISADNIPVDGRTRSAGFADRYVIAVLSSRFCSAVNPRSMRRVR